MLAKPVVAKSTHPLRRLVDLAHRWIGLLVFGQVLAWSIGGCLMYTLDFSDLYTDPPTQVLQLPQTTLSPGQLQQKLSQLIPGSQLTAVDVKNVGGKLAYLLKRDKGPPVLIGSDGQRLDPLKPEWAATIAQLGYTGTGQINRTELLKESKGNYFSSSPIYRVSFDDDQKTEIYVDPVTGDLLARRKALWGLYNRMWELHLMKYTPWPGVNKMLLLVFAILNALVALTGFVKFFRWGYRLRRPTAAETPAAASGISA